jgi:hypothetical protein
LDKAGWLRVAALSGKEVKHTKAELNHQLKEESFRIKL